MDGYGSAFFVQVGGYPTVLAPPLFCCQGWCPLGSAGVGVSANLGCAGRQGMERGPRSQSQRFARSQPARCARRVSNF